MAFICYDHTYSVFLKLKKDLKRFQRIVDILVQLIFIAYNGYLLFTNIDRLLYFIIYSILLFLCIGYFLFTIYAINNNTKKLNKNIKPRVKQIVNILKYIIKFTIITLAVIELCTTEYTTMKLASTIASSVSLLVQITINLITRFVNNYIDLFIESLKMDYENSTALKALKKGVGAASVFAEGGFSAAADYFKADRSEAELTNKEKKLREEIDRLSEPLREKREKTEGPKIDIKEEIKKGIKSFLTKK